MDDRQVDQQDGRVHCARDGAVAVLTLDRPAKLNAMTVAMTDALVAHCAAIEADPDIRVVLLRGEGPKGFCAGSDIGSLALYASAWEFRDRREYADVIRGRNFSLFGQFVGNIKGVQTGGFRGRDPVP